MDGPTDVSDLAEAPLRYVVACQPVHERLREAAIQLGGLSLMTMLRREDAFDLETPLRIASGTVAEAGEALRDLAVPDAADGSTATSVGWMVDVWLLDLPGLIWLLGQ